MSDKKINWNINVDIGGIKDVDILLFTKHLSVTLKSGLTLVESLEILQGQGKWKMKKMIVHLSEIVGSGNAFHEALSDYSKHFSSVYINMVKSGELSGTLQENIARLAIQLSKAQKLRKKIKSAMIYPILVFVAVFGLGMSVAIFVLPKILPLFSTLDVELPITTRWLIYVAELFEQHGFSILIGIIVVVSFLSWLLRRDFVKPLTHRIILKIPVIKNIVVDINLESFSRMFGILLESGLTVDRSLRIVAEGMENRVYKKAILSLLPDVEAGNSLAISFAKYPELFTVITSGMIGVGERTGNLDDTLKYLSKFYESEVDEATKNLSTIIEPVLLIFIGIVVGTVAISILGPIYQITGNLR